MATKDQVTLIIPTSINVLTAVNEALLTQHKAGNEMTVVLPSLRRRALLIVKEIGVLPIQTATTPNTSFSR